MFGPIIERLTTDNRKSAFKTWKRNCFGEKFLQTMQQHILFDKQIETVRRVVYAWRKYAHLERNKEVMTKEVQSIQLYNHKKRLFQGWFNAAMERVPMSLFANKVQRAQRKVTMRVAF